MNSNFKKYFFYLSILVVSLLYIYDLGNLDALRQGTEGFYLQVSKEMYELNSFLTPYYRGQRHWSKPFLHFVLPFPLYLSGIFTNVHAARLSIVILSLISIIYSSKWLEKYSSISKHTTFLFFFSSIALLKYSRIFMMEIPLSLFAFCASLCLYDFFVTKKFKYLLLSSLLLTASILIKGPVTLVLSGLSITIYILYSLLKDRSLFLIKKATLYYTMTIFISSLWFLYCYSKYGAEFFDYFFLRENLGKFNTISYPMRHVFQGLFLFSIPWSFYLIPITKKVFRHVASKRIALDPLRVYLVIHCLVFFVVWLVPTQRSHHYALPAIPFFLTLILLELKDFKILYSSFVKYISYILYSIIFIFTSTITYFFDNFSSSSLLFLVLILTLTLYVFAFILFYKSKSLTTKAICNLIFICWTWIVVSPIIIPAQLPSRAIEVIGDKNLVGYINKPFFIEEAIGREMKVVRPSELVNHINESDIFMLDKDHFEAQQLSSQCSIIYEWKIWKRRTRISGIYNALSSNDIESIKTTNVLFSCPSKN